MHHEYRNGWYDYSIGCSQGTCSNGVPNFYHGADAARSSRVGRSRVGPSSRGGESNHDGESISSSHVEVS